MPDYENKGRSADDGGYGIRQRGGEPVAIDATTLRVKAHGAARGEAASDALAQEMADNESAREAYRTIQEAGELSLADLVEDMSPKDLAEINLDRQQAHKLARVMEQGVQQASQRVATDLLQETYTDTPGESSLMAQSYSMTPNEGEGDWSAVQRAAKLRGGKMVPVWVVVNESSGMKIEKPFRIQEPAGRIAMILNITGNANDPRIAQIQELYDEHVKLMKGIRQCRQHIKEGQEEYRGRLQSLQMKLEGVNVKLGI